MTNGQIYSFAEAAELRLVKKSIAIEMLQAQVATGGRVVKWITKIANRDFAFYTIGFSRRSFEPILQL